MSTAPHYKHNLRDIEFNLFEFLDVAHTSLGKKPFGDLDEASARQLLGTCAQVAVDALAPSFAGGELSFERETGTVRLPAGFKAAFDAYFDNGLNLLDVPTALGGLGAPPTLAWGAFELVVGANPSLAFYFLGNILVRVVDGLATESQRARFVKPMLERRWGGTMVLTEPDAGSDVGAGRAKARHVKDDVWEIEGVKRFITNGDFDATENIVHLVLARPEGAKPGTKGLSMFLVPKFWVNEDGSLGERNGVYVSNLEKKMGLTLSATCELTFGDKHPARGFLVGNVHDGIRQMFHVIEHARMAIGQKSYATLSTAYLNALDFAKERIQGTDLKDAANKAAERVAIIKHPDVRRMLMLQKAFAEGMRGLHLFAASLQDQVAMQGGHAAAEAAEANALSDLLLPLLKGYNSEKVYELLALSLQTFGGSGYLADYPIEHYIRDQKIDSLYEGTTHIQALDLIFRKVARDGGATLQALLGRVKATLEAKEGGDALAPEREKLGAAVGHLEAAWNALLEKLGDSLYHVGLQGNRLLFSTAEVAIGWVLLRHAALAAGKQAKATGPDAAYYAGKVASARFYCHEVLPGIELTARAVRDSSLLLMEVPDEAF